MRASAFKYHRRIASCMHAHLLVPECVKLDFVPPALALHMLGLLLLACWLRCSVAGSLLMDMTRMHTHGERGSRCSQTETHFKGCSRAQHEEHRLMQVHDVDGGRSRKPGGLQHRFIGAGRRVAHLKARLYDISRLVGFNLDNAMELQL